MRRSGRANVWWCPQRPAESDTWLQIAKAHGAYVIGTACTAKHEFLSELGVDEAVDYMAAPVQETIHNVDAVIQMFGGDAGLAALECFRPDYLVEPDGTGLQEIAKLVRSGSGCTLPSNYG